MMKKYLLALDQGTTSSRAILFDSTGKIFDQCHMEFRQIYPKQGWVEQDPQEIWESVLVCIRQLFSKHGLSWKSVDSIGITNQRETTVVWEKATGRAVHPAIVWQCRRTTERCNEIKKSFFYDTVYQKTGLIVDPYFCATKIEYILNLNDSLRRRAEKGELAFGTIDSYLVFQLTKGKHHVTDYSNASRTMLFHIHDLQWDKELLDFFEIPEAMLPNVISNSQNYIDTDPDLTGGVPVPIAGIIGDQQAALFGQKCFEKGDIKNTYGTGCFLLMNTGGKAEKSKNNLLTTIAWQIEGKTTYALEGSVFIGGAVVQWLRDGVHFIEESADSEKAAVASKNNSVLFVPAFTGLGAPYWEPEARGALLGMTRDTSPNDIAKAALESIAYQTSDLVRAMKNDFGKKLGKFYADGGASANSYLMQFQADILQMEVNAVRMRETTALGAAYLAGLATGFFRNMDEIMALEKESIVYTPKMSRQEARSHLSVWSRGVDAVKQFGNPDTIS